VGVIYDRLGSRRLVINKGLIVIFPFLSILWFIMCIFNIRAPPSVTLLSEIFLTISLLRWDWILCFWLIIINFMGIVFTFYLYSQRQQGKIWGRLVSMSNISVRELAVGGLHRFSIWLIVFVFWLLYLSSFIKIWNCDFQDAFSLK
jgi:formate hydrogenlyase subunit 3/multisubunit Na+/H+ antiporter MnhD subunit